MRIISTKCINMAALINRGSDPNKQLRSYCLFTCSFKSNLKRKEKTVRKASGDREGFKVRFPGSLTDSELLLLIVVVMKEVLRWREEWNWDKARRVAYTRSSNGRHGG